MTKRINLPWKTSGGTQLWTDFVWRDGWRIQQHALTGHWRLLDHAQVRRAWGSRAECQAVLEQVAPRGTDDSGRNYVVLLHGLMRTQYSMKRLEQALHQAGYEHVIRVAYASSRRSIAEHAASLRELLENLPADAEFRFVGHSMGGIVIRHLVGDLQGNRDSDPDQENDPAAILGRSRALVMLGPPNQGAGLARMLSKLLGFESVTGPGAVELGRAWHELEARLGTPPFPFGIIAGDCSTTVVQNPLLDRESDLIVAVDEAKLEGAEAFATIPVAHSFLMTDSRAIELTIQFLQEH